MVEVLKLYFHTDESVICFIIRNAKSGLERDFVEQVMETIVNSEAFEGVTGAYKAVYSRSDVDIIYEAA